MNWNDPNADLEHTNLSTYGAGGDCLTCGVKWPCPTVARRMTAGNRWIETPDGHAQCPRCEQKARTA